MLGCERIWKGDWSWFAASVVILLVGCQRDISGAYLASDQSAVCWLELVRTPDNHVTGQLVASVLKPDGSIDHDSISVTGAVDGENVSLSGSRLFGLQNVTLSGTLRGDVLTLSGIQAIPISFIRSSMTEYQQQESRLNARSQTIIKANVDAQARAEAVQAKVQADQAAAQAKFQADQAVLQEQLRVISALRNFSEATNQAIEKMQRFDSEADVHLGRFPGAEKSYEAITAKITRYVARERELADNPVASVARSQLSVAATQASFTTDQIHNQVQTLGWNFQENVKPITDELAELERTYCGAALNSTSLSPAQVQTRDADCARLGDAATSFRQKFNSMAAGLVSLERVYRVERTRQQQLLQEAERMQ